MYKIKLEQNLKNKINLKKKPSQNEEGFVKITIVLYFTIYQKIYPFSVFLLRQVRHLQEFFHCVRQ